MPSPNWSEVASVQIQAPRWELWVRVMDFVRGPRRIRIEASGRWYLEYDMYCGPDGRTDDGFDEKSLHKAALRGCLLAKIGGSAGDTPGDGLMKAVGSYCVFEIGADMSGALFVTMNDRPERFYKHSGELTVTVYDAPPG